MLGTGTAIVRFPNLLDTQTLAADLRPLIPDLQPRYTLLGAFPLLRRFEGPEHATLCVLHTQQSLLLFYRTIYVLPVECKTRLLLDHLLDIYALNDRHGSYPASPKKISGTSASTRNMRGDNAFLFSAEHACPKNLEINARWSGEGGAADAPGAVATNNITSEAVKTTRDKKNGEKWTLFTPDVVYRWELAPFDIKWDKRAELCQFPRNHNIHDEEKQHVLV